MTRQNNKRADRKVESNDSPEIPDRRETSEMKQSKQSNGQKTSNDMNAFLFTVIYLLKAYSPFKCTGSPQSFSQIQILYKSHKNSI